MGTTDQKNQRLNVPGASYTPSSACGQSILLVGLWPCVRQRTEYFCAITHASLVVSSVSAGFRDFPGIGAEFRFA
jgi:hypothetical protein